MEQQGFQQASLYCIHPPEVLGLSEASPISAPAPASIEGLCWGQRLGAPTLQPEPQSLGRVHPILPGTAAACVKACGLGAAISDPSNALPRFFPLSPSS